MATLRAPTRFLILAALLACSLGGCAAFQSSPSAVAPPPPTPEQQAWWQANKNRAKYIANRGYYVEGSSGFFDDRGRPLPPGAPSTSIPEAAEAPEVSLVESMSPGNAYKNFKKLIGRGPNEAVARKAFEEGEQLFRQANYKEAGKKFRIAYDRWPDSPLEEEALFLAGECRFFTDHYVKADDNYGELIKKYSGSEHLDSVIKRRFAIAHYWEQYDNAHPHWPVTPNLVDGTRPLFDTLGHAVRIYEKIRMDDPTGPLADDSIMATANIYFLHHRYDEADYNYTLLRNEYPKSEHQFQAHLLGLKSKLLRYQGPQYEGAPLDESEELVDQTLSQFPTELGQQDKERLLVARAEIRAAKAQRDWEVAQYYQQGKYYGAAKVYYENIAKNYPDTRLAQEALAHIEQNRGLPDSPTPPFKWLVDMIDDSGKTGPRLAARPSTTDSPVRR